MLITGTHSPSLAALSILIAAIASYTALDLAGNFKNLVVLTQTLISLYPHVITAMPQRHVWIVRLSN
ncbi:hypothetical protein [Bosea sp. PAMC 26642]|uniref:hypothetical protein n=1 Tax=Bosea sp. (strain PAMC 26642) TaxID=1792307 RepID=UPI000AA28B56|nr:hypothetical protein [Bosea sp. PAMC 26642]